MQTLLELIKLFTTIYLWLNIFSLWINGLKGMKISKFGKINFFLIFKFEE